MTMTDEQWLPLGVEGDQVAVFTLPWTEIPAWFQQSLWEWIGPNLLLSQYGGEIVSFRVGLLRQAERVLHVKLPVFEDHRVSTGMSSLRSKFDELGSDDLLRFVDFLMSGLPEGHEYLGWLEEHLVESGSGWSVGTRAGKPGLVQRLPAGVRDAATEAVRLGDAGKRLSLAWEATFGVNPDPSNGYRLAVKAVEDAVIPVVCPSDTTATLGKVIGQINAGSWKPPFLREDAKSPTHDVLVGMLRTLWVGQHDRHGGPSTVGVPDATQAEAEAAVMLAVTLVGWFSTGKVQQ